MTAADIGYATHSTYSAPGRWAALLEAVPAEPEALAAVARNLIAHYRVNAADLPETTRADIHLRWLDAMLEADQQRNARPLAAERPLSDRLQGCCRDHTLLCVGVLRQHGVAARSRVGFATYFRPDWNHDHVVVEAWLGGRWARFDPEFVAGSMPFDPRDIPAGGGAPFVTAAEAWLAHRAGRIDVETYGVDADSPVRGAWFVRSYVFMELAHRMKDELLLWDGWGVMGPDADGADDLADAISALLVAADAGDAAAEAELVRRYRADSLLHPGDRIQSFSPYGEIVEVSLTR